MEEIASNGDMQMFLLTAEAGNFVHDCSISKIVSKWYLSGHTWIILQCDSFTQGQFTCSNIQAHFSHK